VIIGIDLGTTNSAAAIWRDGAPELIPNRLGHVLTPSAVSVDGDAVLVGLAARERLSSHAANTAVAFKRYMGTAHQTKLGRKSFSPEELSALVLRSLREDAEASLGETVNEAVITVPAYFNDRQRRATRRAGELAGFKVERLINEPTAAALAYGIHQRDVETRFMVFDLGGGTFDVSLLEMFEGVIEVRASTGDNRLGGDDFNEILSTLMKERFGKAWDKDLRNEQLIRKVAEQAERARRALSEADEATLRIVWRDQANDLTISAALFEERAAPLLARLCDPVLRSLRDSGIDPKSLAEIILIGGATRMPIVRRAVTRMFGRFPNASVNPDEAVALGAAVQAVLRNRAKRRNIGPSASTAASAIRAVTSTPTVPSNSISADSQSRSAGVTIALCAGSVAALACVAVSATLANSASSRSAKAMVAEPWPPTSRPAIWSGAPASRFHTTL
jgi:molecular chaperone HscC